MTNIVTPIISMVSLNKMVLNLSFFLNEETPIYGGANDVSIQPVNSISKGDSANTKRLNFSNHSGTHIDYPNHFVNEGKVSTDYDADFWIFNNPYVLNYSASENELIDLSDELLNQIPKETDFLILNTGFWKKRMERVYWENNPGISPELAQKLKDRLPSLRVLGADLISITSFQNRPTGRVTHKIFLNEPSILLIEDMDLSKLNSIPKKVIALPLLLKGADGAPINVIAEL